MDVLSVLVFTAMICAVGALAFGVASMASDHPIARLSGGHWMAGRVGFQALAFALILLALLL